MKSLKVYKSATCSKIRFHSQPDEHWFFFTRDFFYFACELMTDEGKADKWWTEKSHGVEETRSCFSYIFNNLLSLKKFSLREKRGRHENSIDIFSSVLFLHSRRFSSSQWMRKREEEGRTDKENPSERFSFSGSFLRGWTENCFSFSSGGKTTRIFIKYSTSVLQRY